MAEQAEQMALEQENQRALDELREKLCREKELVRRGWKIRRLELPGNSAPMGHVPPVKTATLRGTGSQKGESFLGNMSVKKLIQ